MDIEYVDCKITVLNLRRLKIRKDGWEDSVEGNLHWDRLTELTIDCLNDWADYALKIDELRTKLQFRDKKSLSDPFAKLQLVKVLGLHLYHILFSDQDIANAFRRAHKEFEDSRSQLPNNQKKNLELRMRLKLVFEPDAITLERLPWEFLRVPWLGDEKDGKFFISNDDRLLLIRYVPPPRNLAINPPSGKLKILVVISSPEGPGWNPIYDNSNPDDEIKGLLKQIRDIQGALVKVMLTKPNEVDERISLTYDEMTEQNLNNVVLPIRPTYKGILAALKDTPDIFHFIGHGIEGQLVLIMEDDDPDYDGDAPPALKSSEQIKSLFEKNKPRLVFLHACRGAKADSLTIFKSTARELIGAGIPAVIAMQHDITIQDGATFARKFYSELSLGRPIDEAVKAARIELGIRSPEWLHCRFASPVVYLQLENAMVSITEDKNGIDQSGDSDNSNQTNDIPNAESPGTPGSKFSRNIPVPTPIRSD